MALGPDREFPKVIGAQGIHFSGEKLRFCLEKGSAEQGVISGECGPESSSQ